MTAGQPKRASLPVLFATSVALHGGLGLAVSAMPVAVTAAMVAPVELSFEVLPAERPSEPLPEPDLIPEPETTPEPEIPVAPVRPSRAPRAQPAAPAPAEPSPEPRPAPAALPSADEIFAEPAPLPSLTSEEGSSFAVAAGASDGAPGGRGRGGAVAGSATGTEPAGQPGPSADQLRLARRSYSRAIFEILSRAARYPIAARAQRLEGRVELGLRIDPSGRLLGARILRSSGHAVLDEAAIATAEQVGEFPAPPAIGWSARDELRTPLVYELTR